MNWWWVDVPSGGVLVESCAEDDFFGSLVDDDGFGCIEDDFEIVLCQLTAAQ